MSDHVGSQDPPRTIDTIEAEIGRLQLEARKLKSTCECRLNALHIYPHQRKCYKKCLCCGRSISIEIGSEEFDNEIEGVKDESKN